MAKRKYISGMVACVIMFFSFLGTMQIFKSVSFEMNIIKEIIAFHSNPLVRINRTVTGSTEDFKSEPSKDASENRENNFADILFFLLNTVLISNEKSFLFILFFAMFLLSSASNKLNVRKFRTGSVKPPDWLHYLRWRLKFVTPLQKCMQNRSDEFDINPIRRLRDAIVPCGINRALKFLCFGARFFIWYE